ncbi:MAG: hypothetical protein KGL16_05120, partial [Acidobacteriota bacterium]|nr:hypothetical protein [Acidobacteriota bacterium]
IAVNGYGDCPTCGEPELVANLGSTLKRLCLACGLVPTPSSHRGGLSVASRLWDDAPEVALSYGVDGIRV